MVATAFPAQPLDSDLTALAALSTTAYGRALLEVANLAAINAILNAGGGIGAQVRVLWYKTGVDMNVTTDQALTKNGTFTNYMVTQIQFVNPSTSLTTAVGGIYSAAAKGGDALVANTQVYTSATNATSTQTLTRTAQCGLRSDAALYLSLTTPQGAAATGDLYLFGVPLS